MASTHRRNEPPVAAPTAIAGQPAAEAPRERIQKPAEPPAFWDHLASLEDGEWTHHKLYLYRLEPKIDKAGENAFIAIYQRVIDQADVLADHGSGRYLAILNNTRARKSVNKATFTIHNDQFPPKVQLAQLVPTPENEKWLEWLQKAKPAAAAEAGTTASPGATDGSLAQLTGIIKGVMEKGNMADANIQTMLMDAHSKAIEMVASQGKGNTDLTALLEALTKAKALMTPAAPPADSLNSLTTILAIVEKLHQQQTAAPPPDPLASLERTIEVMTKVKDFTGGTESPARESTSLIEKGLDFLGRVLTGPMGQALGARMMGAGGPGGPAAAIPSHTTVHQQPAGSSPPAASAAPPEFDAGEPAREVTGQLMTAPAPAEQFVANPQVILMLADFARSAMIMGLDGAQLAELFIAQQGNNTYDAVISVPPEKLFEAVIAVPAAASLLAPFQAKLPALIEAFYAYNDGADDADEPEPEGEPHAQAATA